ncbi:MAG: hypothetical protein WD401_06515 [Thermomicrobiaceae bacterium]
MTGRDERPIPVARHDLVIVSGRVVKVETKHIAELTWLAKGLVSEHIPTGPLLSPSLEVSAIGRTEREAIDSLKKRIIQIDTGD